MGMTLIGLNPTGPRGEYFRNNIFKWHPLARYCNLIAPEICAPCKDWHSNGDDCLDAALDAAGAIALADVLEREIEAGWTAAYGAFVISQLKAKSGEQFQEIKLANVINHIMGSVDWTEGDGGTLCEPSDFVENVTAFVAFLRESGGFSIR